MTKVRQNVTQIASLTAACRFGLLAHILQWGGGGGGGGGGICDTKQQMYMYVGTGSVQNDTK